MDVRKKEALVPYYANGKVDKSKRGARVTGVGKRDYDIIPSFQVWNQVSHYPRWKRILDEDDWLP